MNFLENVIYYVCVEPTAWPIAVGILLLGLFLCIVDGIIQPKTVCLVGKIGTFMFITGIVASLACLLIWAFMYWNYEPGDCTTWQYVAVGVILLGLLSATLLCISAVFFKGRFSVIFERVNGIILMLSISVVLFIMMFRSRLR